MLSAWGKTLFARSAFKGVSQLCARSIVTESARMQDLAVHLEGLNEPAHAAVLQLIKDTKAREAPPPYGQAEEAFRRHNSSLQQLEGQCVYGKIIKVERKFVWVDVGIRGYTRIAKKELRFTQLVASRRGGGQRKGSSDFRIGDVMTFFIEDLETPFGDMMLTATGQAAQDDKGTAVWDALAQQHANKQPVQGRVLNAVNGGFAVGLAGVIAFCPYAKCSILTASRIGILQPFVITSMIEERRNIVVADYRTLVQMPEIEERRRALVQKQLASAPADQEVAW